MLIATEVILCSCCLGRLWNSIENTSLEGEKGLVCAVSGVPHKLLPQESDIAGESEG